jgi:hypothetical protein
VNRFQVIKPGETTPRGLLPELLEECLLNCQDEYAGLYDLEATEVERLVTVLRKHRVTTARGLDIRLRTARLKRKAKYHARND